MISRLRLLLLIFMGVVTVGCSEVSRVKDEVLGKAVTFIPPETIESLDKKSWNSLRKQKRVIDDPKSSLLLKELARPLIIAAEKRGAIKLKWDFFVIDSKELNAFALPGGTIAVNSGLLAHSETGLEVIGVLGHEVGHVMAQHGLKSMITQAGLGLALSLVMGDMGSLSQVVLQKAD